MLWGMSTPFSSSDEPVILVSGEDLFWQKYQQPITFAFVLLLGLAGFLGWRFYTKHKNEKAAWAMYQNATQSSSWLEITQIYPQTSAAADVLLNLASQAVQENKYSQAVDYYQKFLAIFKKHPTQPAAEFAAAMCLEIDHKNADARKAYEAIINAKPEHPFFVPAKLGLARLDIAENKLANAREHLKLIVAEYRDNPFWNEANLLLSQNNLRN